MPRRRRIDKRRDSLTMQRHMMLTIGPIPGPASLRPCPDPGSAEWQTLEACYWQHRDRFGEGSWGHLAFEVGDVEAALRANPLVPVE